MGGGGKGNGRADRAVEIEGKRWIVSKRMVGCLEKWWGLKETLERRSHRSGEGWRE